MRSCDGKASILAQDWRALQWLHEDLRSDEEVIRTVVQHNFLCLTLALEDGTRADSCENFYRNIFLWGIRPIG